MIVNDTESADKLAPGCHLSREPQANVGVVSERRAGAGGTLHRDEDPRRHRERVSRLPAAGHPHAPRQWPLHARRHQLIRDGPERGGCSLHEEALEW